jgi:hypothetical protein
MGRRHAFLRKIAGATKHVEAKSPILAESQMRVIFKLCKDLFKLPIGMSLDWMPNRKSECSLY